MGNASKVCQLIALLALAWPARAAIEVSFEEDAPKDRFVITNASECAVEDLHLIIDLGPSAGGLYFDTTGTGAGVQVFQPFEATDGAVRLVQEDGAARGVADGESAVRVHVARLAAGARVAFTIDVDDSVVGGQLGQSRVASAEIAGARIGLERIERPTLEGIFDATGRAVTPALGCASATG